MRRLIECTKKLRHLSFKTRLSLAAREDIMWWLLYINVWNRHSIFYDNEWRNANDFVFSTDASNLAGAAVLRNKWLILEFTPEQLARPIAWRELCAVVVACATWGNMLTGHKILIDCDNTAVVESVNKGSCKDVALMELIRALFFIAALNNFDIRLRYIQSKLNRAADLLSRLKIDQFKLEFPKADAHPTTPCIIPMLF